MSLRLGLCCIFIQEPIRFRSLTAKALLALPPAARRARIDAVCRHNAESLVAAIQAVIRLGIEAFRILSPLLPRITHPQVGYRLEDLPSATAIRQAFSQVRDLAKAHDIRLSFHPDQFVVPASPNPAVRENSLRELTYHGWLADLLGAEVINLHAGGAYGDPAAALTRFAAVFRDLPEAVRTRLTVENDDRVFSPRQLLPLTEATGIPLVYDVHHHRCLPDDLSIDEATALAAATWAGREPYCHISSPLHPWGSGDPKPHADFIDPADVPCSWLSRSMTVDVEAKAKELAVLQLQRDLERLPNEHPCPSPLRPTDLR